MIRTLFAHALGAEPALARDMFRLRAQVFHERLRWDVTVEDGLERDVYDTLDPLYVLSLDAGGGLRGAVRILPTTGRHMMADVFNDLFDTPLEIASPQIWECTRFCVRPDGPGGHGPSGLDPATSELLLGICDAALAAGVDQILGVSEVPMLRIYRRAGWTPHIVGRSDRAGHTPVFAGLWDVTRAARRTIEARAGLEPPAGGLHTLAA